MPVRAPLHRPQPQRRDRRLYDRDRGSASARGYDRAWQKLRKEHLDQHPLCADCLEEGRLVEATEVDHVEPIEKAPERRLDPTNLRSQCKPHHSAKTAREQAAARRGQG